MLEIGHHSCVLMARTPHPLHSLIAAFWGCPDSRQVVTATLEKLINLRLVF